MTSVLMEEVNEDHACTLCFELFLYPATLPCKHVFCKPCLDRHIANNGFTCPICRHRLSNWLRRLNANKLNIVDNRLWSQIQEKYPEAVEKRKNGDSHESLEGGPYSLKISFNDKDLNDRISNCHSIEDIAEDKIEEWKGWPVADSTCSDVINRLLREIGNFHDKSSKHIKIIPKHNFAKPGEIREEFDVELRRFEQENEQREKESLRLSEALIKLIEEDERKELELLQKQKEEQLRIDEELAKSLIENERDAVVTLISDSSGCGTNMDVSNSSANACSGCETHVETDVTNSSPYACSEDRINDLFSGSDSPVFLGPCTPSSRLNTLQPSSLFSTNHDQPTCSTPRTSEGPSASSMPLSSSPIPLDTPSCSKVDIFAKFWTSRNQVEETKKSSITMLTPPNESTDVTPAVTSISNQKLSHFAPVAAGPATSKIDSGGETLPMSRSSSGADSIEQELCHFKPIRASPTTPPKDGKSRWLPQVVVPQRSVSGTELSVVTNNLSREVISVLSSNPNIDLSVEDLEESQALQTQLEADRVLALKIQNEWACEEKKRKRTISTGVKTEYNLRKKGKKDLRKKVLMARRQTTLDTMLIK